MGPMRNVLIVVAALAASSCSRAPAAGSERGPCRAGKACDPGLTCLSDVCVRPPPADCGAVAEALAAITVGNYAPRDERAKAVGDLRATCEKARLSADEGKCIIAAKGRFALSKCPRPLLPGLADLAKDPSGCHAVAAHMEEIGKAQMDGMPPAMRAVLPRLIEVVESSCTDEAWSDEVKGCLLEASPQVKTSVDGCMKKMSSVQRRKFQDRVMAVVQEVMAAQPPGQPPTAKPPATQPSPPQTQPSPPQTQPSQTLPAHPGPGQR
jgi:hypothetical protein